MFTIASKQCQKTGKTNEMNISYAENYETLPNKLKKT